MATLIVAAAVIIENGRVLLTQRLGGKHLEHLWEFPGGKVEEGEAPEAALVRELREEIGVETVVEDILDVTYWRYPKRDVLLLFYRVARAPGAGEVQDVAVAAHAWVSRDELDRYPMPPADVPVLAKVRRLLGG
jgi:8-oxo-dGTP diphosphatase